VAGTLMSQPLRATLQSQGVAINATGDRKMVYFMSVWQEKLSQIAIFRNVLQNKFVYIYLNSTFLSTTLIQL
jgi:hypothetical protein